MALHSPTRPLINHHTLYGVLVGALLEILDKDALPVSYIQAHNARLALDVGAPMSTPIPFDRTVTREYFLPDVVT